MANVAFFNAITPEALVHVDWSGQDAFPNGLGSGRSMGPLMIPEGEASIEVKANGFQSGTATVKLDPGFKKTLVFYAVQSAGPEKKQPVIKVWQSLPVSVIARKELEWPVLFLGADESANIEVNGEAVTLRRGKITLVAKGKKFVRLSQGERELAAVSVQEPSDRLFVVFGSDRNDLKAGVVYR